MSEDIVHSATARRSSLSLGFVMGFFLPMPPVAGGATEKVTQELACRLHDMGDNVTIYTRRWPGLSDQVTGRAISYVRMRGMSHSRWLPMNLLRDFFWAIQATRAVQDHDVIISHSIFFPILYRWRRGKKAGVAAWIGRMPKGQTRWYDRAAALIAPSQALAERIRQENPRLAERIVRIPYPIDWAGLSASPRQKNEVVTIGYVGRIHPEKGVDILIDAASRLAHHSLPDWRVLIMGPSATSAGGAGDDYLRSLQRRIPDQLRQKILFLPPLYDPEKLAAHYAQLDIFCYPSKSEKGETFGVAPLEAMAAGAVPIVSDLNCFRDYLVPEKNGLSFSLRNDDPADALAQLMIGLLRDPDERDRLAAAARQDAAVYDYAEVTRVLRNLLSTLASR